MKRIFALGAILLALASPARADNQASTVMPLTGPLSFSDFLNLKLNPALQALMTCNFGVSAPANGPGAAATNYQCWADTSGAPNVNFKVYDGTQWVTFGTLNTTNHTWSPVVNTLATPAIITGANANALAVGRQGTVNPAFQVDSATALQATGLKITGAAGGAGVALDIISSAPNEGIFFNGKGNGAILLNNTGTGQVRLAQGGGGVLLGSAITYGGVTANNAVTGTGNMVLSASPTFTGTVTMATLSPTAINAFALGGQISGGGNNVDNVVIGSGTPLAGAFTTLVAGTSVRSPLYLGGTAAGSTATLNGTNNGSPVSAYVLLNTNGQNTGVGGQSAPQTLLHIGPGNDAPNLSSATLYLSNNGATAFSVRDSANDIEFGMFTNVSPAIAAIGTRTNNPLWMQLNNNNVAVWDTAGGLSVGDTTGPGVLGAIKATAYVQVGTKIRAAGSAPTITAGCNGAGSSISGSDLAGTVTGQTAAATTCTITFNSAYGAEPYCQATGLTSPLTGSITQTAGSLIVNFASTANYKFTYHCTARATG